jgi:hypothetical protein
VEATGDLDQASRDCCRPVWGSQPRKNALPMGEKHCCRTCCALGWVGGEREGNLSEEQRANHVEAKVAACCDRWMTGRWREVTAVIVLFG